MNKEKTNLVARAMEHRRIVILITVCLIAFGAYSLGTINKNEFPDFTIRQGVVVAVYPGASSEQIEKEVTKPLEDYIFSYSEVKKTKTKSFSRDGMAIVQVELNGNTNQIDKEAFWSRFKLGVQTFKSSLPAGVAAIVVKDDFGDTAAMLLTLESKDKSYRELNEWMKNLEDDLCKIDAVGKMNVYGLQKEQISVYVDNDKLSHFGINSNTLSLTLLKKGFLTTGGVNELEDADSPIYVTKSLNSVEDVKNTLVYSDPSGNVIRLGDIARVVKEYPDPTSYITNNGSNSLLLSIEMKKGRSITTMGKEIDTCLDQFKSSLPDDVTVFKITDQAQVVRSSIDDFLLELLIAVIAVIIVVMLLMPMDVALVAASTIPITIFIALGVFKVSNIELNTVSLAALIAVLGMIVDNSIVIIDNYVEQLKEGVPPKQASIESSTHFFKAILTATLAITLTFFPLLFTMDGMMGDFIKVFPWAISIVLFVSLFVAEMLVPFLQLRFVKLKQVKTNKKGEPRKSFIDRLQGIYDKVVSWCFANKALTMSIGVLSILGGVFLMTKLPMRLMPIAERNQFAVEIYMPSGTPIEKTKEVADSLEGLLRQDDRIVSIASFKGTSSPRFHTAYAPQFAGPNYAQFVVNTKGPDATNALLEKYRMTYDDYFPEAYVRFKQLSYGEESNPIEVILYGEDWSNLKSTADQVEGIMRRDPDLRLVRSDVLEPLVATKVTLDPNASERLSLGNASVELALASGFNENGIPLGTVWEDDYGIDVKLKKDHSGSYGFDAVENELIPVYGGLSNVPLRQVAEVRPEWHDGQLCHRGGIRSIMITAETATGVNVLSQTKQVQENLSGLSLPEGVTLSYKGQAGVNADTLPGIYETIVIAAIIIFFLILFHYQKIRIAVLLLISLLLVIPGTALGILIQGVDFSMTCFMGIISLMGILVRNAIIMYDYARELSKNEGMSVNEAILFSAKRRMRPIFLTSAAASMGVIPMIISGSSLWMPMGAVICYGTIITMILILTVLPVAYSLIMKD